MFRYSSFPRCLELDSDYITGPDWAFSNLGAGNFQADEYATSIWTGCYNLIHRANVAIHYVNEITGADEKVKRNALGELYFQKAFSYFLLTRAYGEIPLFDVAISEGASYNQPRRPIPDVYAEIIRLLEQAAGMMYKIRMPNIKRDMSLRALRLACWQKCMPLWGRVRFRQEKR